MFKKHEFTCPDVIYLRNKQKKNAYTAIALQVLFIGGMWSYGSIIERRNNKRTEELNLTEES